MGPFVSCVNKSDPHTSATDVKIDDSNDIVELPYAAYAMYKYDSSLQTDVLIYQYPDLWDIDGDDLMDSITFIGNGGAHQYFHLEIKLSSESDWIQYKYLKIDMPYLFDSINYLGASPRGIKTI
ncbi:MAG: hypothetical protein WDZ35_01910 [Crocinitomicaceae bacterium]